MTSGMGWTVKDVTVSGAEAAQLHLQKAEFVSTGWLVVDCSPGLPIRMDADFEHTRTVTQLAQEQRDFLKNVPTDLLDVPLPSDMEST